jgi:importin subunit beta-1
MEVVCNAAQSADTQVRIVALQCLVRIMSLYYPLMAPYIEVLFRTTVEAMKDADEAVVLQGIEFWSTTCEEEMILREEVEEVGSHHSYSPHPHSLEIASSGPSSEWH